MKVKVERGKCPLCGSKKVSYENSEMASDFVYFQCHCKACKASWDENYIFESIGCVQDKNGNDVCEYAES